MDKLNKKYAKIIDKVFDDFSHMKSSGDAKKQEKQEEKIIEIIKDEKTNTDNLERIYGDFCNSRSWAYNNEISMYELEILSHSNCSSFLKINRMEQIYTFDFVDFVRKEIKTDKRNPKKYKYELKCFQVCMTDPDVYNYYCPDIENLTKEEIRKIIYTGKEKQSILLLLNTSLPDDIFEEFCKFIPFTRGKDHFKYLIEEMRDDFPDLNIDKYMFDNSFLGLLFKKGNLSMEKIKKLYNLFIDRDISFIYLGYGMVRHSNSILIDLIENPNTPYYILKDLSKRISILNDGKNNDRRDPELYNILQEMIFNHPNYTMKNYIEEFINS